MIVETQPKLALTIKRDTNGCQQPALDIKSPEIVRLFLYLLNFWDDLGLCQTVSWCPEEDSNLHDRKVTAT